MRCELDKILERELRKKVHQMQIEFPTMPLETIYQEIMAEYELGRPNNILELVREKLRKMRE